MSDKTTDILADLREIQNDNCELSIMRAFCGRAADEIERLRANPTPTDWWPQLRMSVRRIGHLERIMRECCDAIRDRDEDSALKMLEVALKERP